jgi:hypothetical protein
VFCTRIVIRQGTILAGVAQMTPSYQTNYRGNTMPIINRGVAVAAIMLLLQGLPAMAQDGNAPVQTEPQRTESEVPVHKAPDMEALEAASTAAYEAEKYVRYYGANIQMMNERPYEAIYMQRVTVASALVGRMKTAYHYMMKMQQQGLSYDLNQDPDTQNIRGTELYDYLNNLMIEAGNPAGVSETVANLGPEFNDPGAITWDESRGRFLVGTRSSGTLLAVGQDGSSEILLQANNENGLWAIKGLHADAANNRLWISSAAIAEFAAFQPTDAGRGALFEFDLKTLELLNRFNLPVDGKPHELGPMTVSKAGDVYIVDHAASLVYRKAAAGKALEQFVGSHEMKALQDIAVTPDNSKLYIADRYKGILVVEPEQETSAMLNGSENMNFGRISSISHDQDKLLIVQAGIQPERLMQLDLDSVGKNVATMLPVASALEEFDHPGLGLIHAGYVYYFANLGVAGQTDENTQPILMRSPFPAQDLAPGLMQKDAQE